MAAAIPWVIGGASILSSGMGVQAQSQQIANQSQALQERAVVTRREGAEQANLIRGQKDPILGQVTAQAAGSGVEVGTGSVLDVIKDSAFNIEMDALTTMNNAERQAKALESEASGAKAGAPSGIGTLLGATGSALSSFSSAKMAFS